MVRAHEEWKSSFRHKKSNLPGFEKGGRGLPAGVQN